MRTDQLTFLFLFAQAAMNSIKWQHRYVISPVSAQARFKRDRSEQPLRTRNRPRFVCDLVLNEVSLTLVDWQYNQMVECVRGLDDIAKYRRFRLMRPSESVGTGAKLWWVYACKCHGLLRNYGSRNTSVEYLRDNIQYLKLYTRLVINPNETLTGEEKLRKDDVERRRDYEELKVLRRICMERVPAVVGAANTPTAGEPQGRGRGMLVQWFPQWWGWYKSEPEANAEADGSSSTIGVEDEQQHADDSTSRIEDDILNALSVSVDNNSVLKRDVVFGKFDFTLKKGTLDICSGDSNTTTDTKPMLQMQFENLILGVESRPRSGSHFVGLSLGSVCLKDRITASTEFPDLVRPQSKDDNTRRSPAPPLKRLSNSMFSGLGSVSPAAPPPAAAPAEPLFVLQYERKPLLYNTDYRLFVKTQSLDIVYNTGAVKWLIDFASKPHQVVSTRRKIAAMKSRTRKELIKNWENMLEGDLMSARKTWTLEIDISAPQIIFVENFSNKNGLIVLMDFGRLQLTNGGSKIESLQATAAAAASAAKSSAAVIEESLAGNDEDEDDDAFMTPCSTPPGSNNTESPTLVTAIGGDLSDGMAVLSSRASADSMLTLNESNLHNRLYDKYTIELTDLQILVCKGKDGWSYASTKGSSPLHVLDRFNISLQIERRVIMTVDPQYPSLKLCGTLPKLVVHANEMKIAALTTMWNIFFDGDHSSAGAFNRSPTAENVTGVGSSDTASDSTECDGLVAAASEIDPQKELAKLVILQFAIDQMVLEVQSRGRGIAELQVTGVKAGFSKRPSDTSATLSVHGLLLADAIQSFGPDFELLIASHRHVGIDSVSGSLKQSGACSPTTSPGSPDLLDRRPTSPNTISKALNSLQKGQWKIVFCSIILFSIILHAFFYVSIF